MIRAVLFDFDGTLTRPEAIDFAELRRALSCPPGAAILEYIEALPSEEARREAWRILDEFELAAARASVPNEGAETFVRLLRDRGIDRGILSRNSTASIMEAFRNFRTISASDFSVFISRESPGRRKPHPDGVLLAARLFGVPPAEVLVVGDFVFDIAAGKAAGAKTALLTNGRARGTTPAAPATGPSLPEAPEAPVPDYMIKRLEELEPILGLCTGNQPSGDPKGSALPGLEAHH
jgi:HAD superfamily hydrolase (TIGR01509 family)